MKKNINLLLALVLFSCITTLNGNEITQEQKNDDKASEIIQVKQEVTPKKPFTNESIEQRISLAQLIEVNERLEEDLTEGIDNLKRRDRKEIEKTLEAKKKALAKKLAELELITPDEEDDEQKAGEWTSTQKVLLWTTGSLVFFTTATGLFLAMYDLDTGAMHYPSTKQFQSNLNYMFSKKSSAKDKTTTDIEEDDGDNDDEEEDGDDDDSDNDDDKVGVDDTDDDEDQDDKTELKEARKAKTPARKRTRTLTPKKAPAKKAPTTRKTRTTAPKKAPAKKVVEDKEDEADDKPAAKKAKKTGKTPAPRKAPAKRKPAPAKKRGAKEKAEEKEPVREAAADDDEAKAAEEKEANDAGDDEKEVVGEDDKGADEEEDADGDDKKEAAHGHGHGGPEEGPAQPGKLAWSSRASNWIKSWF